MKAISLQKRRAHSSFGKLLFRLLKILALVTVLASQPLSSQAAGVTIITHGFHSGTTGWVDDMFYAMVGRDDFPGTEYTACRVDVTRNGVGDLVVSLWGQGGNPLLSDSGEIFVLLDWSEIDELQGSITTTDVAEAVIPKLLDPGFIPGMNKSLAELPIHMVGHSRGGSLVTGLARLLGENGIIVDQVTTLDPHPLPIDEHSPGDNDEVAIYKNVVFADNYYRNDSGTSGGPDGFSVVGGTNIDLTGIVVGDWWNTHAHTDVHTYYHGTIDTVLNFLGPVDTRYISNSWYALPTGPRDSVGYLWSRKVGAQRPLVGVSQDFGGSASRETLNLSAANWPNVVITNAGPLSLLAGQSITLSGLNQDCDSPHTITFYLDTDRNPYNSGLTQLGSPLPRSASGSLVSALPAQTLTVPPGMTSGTYYLCATATDGTRTRYYYYNKSPITVMQTLTKPVVHSPARSAGGQFSFQVSCLPSLFYYVEASTNFLNWEIVMLTNTTTTSFSYQEANSASRPQRFYRVGVGSLLSGMALIPGGSFTMGDSIDNDNFSTPLHTVSVSTFYIGRYEVTKALWDEVKMWNSGNGYDLSSVGSGKATNHPITSVNWYDVVKWCNARSEKENLVPCYYSDAALTTIYKTGQLVPYVKWNASGYRLPTEAEWEKAARGGIAPHRFPWTDSETITHSRANFGSYAGYFYDAGPTRTYHPTFNDGVVPFTSPVGYFAEYGNGYGLYDMAGNVWEWCWDFWETYSSSPQTDPRGPSSGSVRVIRGGSWIIASGTHCRLAIRAYNSPATRNSDGGFRCVRLVGQ